MKPQTAAVLTLGFVARLAVPQLLPGLTKVLDQSVLFSTPINSYRSLKEALFLATNSMNPYKVGEIVHHPPLVLELFKMMPSEWQANVFFAAVDTMFGAQLIALNKRLGKGYSDVTMALFYAFNPLSLLATYAKSTYLLNNLVVITLLNAFVADPQGGLPMVLLAISAYLSYYSWYLIIPLVYAMKAQKLRNVAIFLSTLAALLFASYLLSSLSFIPLVYGTIVQFRKVTPNVGLWWYFFTEIFQFFRAFFLGVFNLYTFLLVVPITLRFISPPASTTADALFAVWTILSALNFSRAYPTITDLSLTFSMSMLFRPLFCKLKLPPAAAAMAMFTIIALLPVFYYVWMGAGSGNANFFYAISLVLSVIQMLTISDFVWSKLQLEYYRENGISTSEKVRLTQI